MNDLLNLAGSLLTPPDRERLEPRERATRAPRILLLYGSLRERSFSRFLTLEAERLLRYLGAECQSARKFGSDALLVTIGVVRIDVGPMSPMAAAW